MEAAWRLLLERGYRGLTIEGVALDAGETPGTVKRHFESKAGLVEELLDAVTNDAYVTLTEHVHQLPPGDERIRAYIEGLHGIIVDAATSRAILEIAPLAVRDELVRGRIAALYRWYRELTLEESGMIEQLGGVDIDPGLRAELERLATVILAALDGLAYQAALDPEGCDTEGALAALSDMVRGRLRELPPA